MDKGKFLIGFDPASKGRDATVWTIKHNTSEIVIVDSEEIIELEAEEVPHSNWEETGFTERDSPQASNISDVIEAMAYRFGTLAIDQLERDKANKEALLKAYGLTEEDLHLGSFKKSIKESNKKIKILPGQKMSWEELEQIEQSYNQTEEDEN